MESLVFFAEVAPLKDKNLIERLSNRISPERLKKANSFKSEKDRLLSFGGGILIDYALEQFGVEDREIYSDGHGKLKLKNGGAEFNMSHSKNAVAVIVSNSVVGIDIEKEREVNLKVANRYFCKNEIDYINNSPDKDKAFLRLWVRKESLLKALGTGIKKGLSSVSVIENNLQFSGVNGKKYYFNDVNCKDYLISCCKEESNSFSKIIEVDFNELIK